MRSLSSLALVACFAVSTPALAFPTAGPGSPGGGHNISRALRSFIKTQKAKDVVLPKNAADYRYVLVKGVIGDAYPRYMARDLAALKGRGLQAEFAPIDTGAGVAHNSAVIEQMIRTTDKPIVFIGHSKGVADTTDAIGRMAKENPQLVQARVRGLVAIEGAYRGSQVADKLASTGWGNRLMKTIAWAVRGKPEAGLDLRTSVRDAAVKDHPMPTNLVPTASLIGYKLSPLRSILGATILYMKKLGLRSDGLVAHGAAHIDGSDFAYANYDHGAGAFFGNSDKMMLGLLGHVLEQPQILVGTP